MPTGPRPKCLDCAYYGGPKQYGFGLTCKAYPKGIPEEILEGKIDHDKPYLADHGIQFEKKREPKKRQEAIPLPQCLNCKYLRRLRRRDPTFTCDAFPDGIPDAIFLEQVDHTKPYSGDHGIHFKQVKRCKLMWIVPPLCLYGGFTLVATIFFNWRWVFLLIPELITYHWITHRRC